MAEKTIQTMICCPRCQTLNPSSNIRCHKCREALYGWEESSICGHRIPKHARYCDECGRRQCDD